jgi:DNA-binding IclR family transcriptional regulator
MEHSVLSKGLAGIKKGGRLDSQEKETKTEYTGMVPAVDQAARILLSLARNNSLKMNLTDICKSVGIHKSKGYSILNTLQKFGFVQKDPAGKTYSLGLGLISLSRRVLDNLNYGDLAGPFLEELAGKTDCTALFGLINNGNVFVVARQEAHMNISVTVRLGHRFSITHGAHGKAIVAFLPVGERKKILNHKKLFFHGDAAKFDPERLEAELAQCIETGFAFDMGELNVGINVIASPVFDSQGRLIGSMFIMGTFPESRIREHGSMVAGTARAFSRSLGADISLAYRQSTKEQ